MVVEATSMQGVPHNLPVQAAAAIRFFGLDTTTPTTAPPTTVPPTTRPPTTPPTTPPTMTPPPTSPPATGGTRSCTAQFAVASAWPGGFVAGVTVTAGPSAITGWTVTLRRPSGAAITNIWNGANTGTTVSCVAT